MFNQHAIRVFFSSRTVGDFKGREGLSHVCHSCDRKLGKKDRIGTQSAIPEEVTLLVFSAQSAAKELQINFELIDVTRMPIRDKIHEMINGRPIPRIDIGSDFLVGIPTKQQIIEFYTSQFGR